jgi:hypothetical protein
MRLLLALTALAALLFATCGSDNERSPSTDSPTAMPAYAIGQEAITPAGSSLTVYTYEQPVVADSQFPSIEPDPGNEYAAIQVGSCVAATAMPTSIHAFYFELQMPDDTRRRSSYPVREPALNSTELNTGDCIRGWVSFQVPVGTRPKLIIFSVDGGASVKWALKPPAVVPETAR